MSLKSPSVPVIDIGPLLEKSELQAEVAHQINLACRKVGFFYVVNHGVSEDLQQRLEEVSQEFFQQEESSKLKIGMQQGGKAWRGYFPVGDELTSGKPDIKEGLYFGEELDSEDHRVRDELPMHGANLFPDGIPNFKETILKYIDAMTQLGQVLMRGISLSLGLEADYFARHYTTDPLVLFRIFHYPSTKQAINQSEQWGVGEHTDYGLLTILKQDQIGGLQVKTKTGWIEAPPVENSFICNIGDMLDRSTRGLHRPTPHRSLNSSGQSRYSYPFFFDPNFDAPIKPVDLSQTDISEPSYSERWDNTNIHTYEGTYGEYLIAKVSKVFPQLRKDVI